MDIALITHRERRTLGWVTDDEATRQLVESLRRSGFVVVVHEVETVREVEALLGRARPTTLAWGNAYTIPDAAGASVDLAAVFERFGAPSVGSGAATLHGLLDKGWCQARLAAATRFSSTDGRAKLDRGNPNPGHLGSDFGRFGLVLWSEQTEATPR